MLIVGTQQSNDAPTLDWLLRDLWARFWARFRGQSPSENRGEDETNDRDNSAGLIL